MELAFDTFHTVLTVICLVVSVAVAGDMNHSLENRDPNVTPYTWGYFIGLMGALSGFCFGLFYFISGLALGADQVFVGGLYLLFVGAVHIFIVKRKRWAWILGTILQLNPILWIINGIYVSKRWQEMDRFSGPRIFDKLSRLPFIKRVFISGAVFWAAVVLAFVFMFEPYGRHIDDSELWQIIKIIIFPPAVAVAGYVLYAKVIREGDKEI